MAVEVIREFDNFTLVRETGTGMNETPYTGLAVRRKGLAEKHVVEVKLDQKTVMYDGTPIVHKYTDVYVSHGMRMKQDTLAETKEYIDVLNEAIDVAFEVMKYCVINGLWAK